MSNERINYYRNIQPFYLLGWGGPQYSSWMDEQMSRKESCYIGDWSFLRELVFEGPDALRLFSDISVNNFAEFKLGQAKHVIANPSNRALTLVTEEVFGPVLVAMPFDDFDDVLGKANDSCYGLSASIWTNRLDKAQRAIDPLHVGTVWVNTHNMVDPNMPFGGFKSSGVGREHGRAAIEAYTETKSVCIAY